MGEVYVGQGDPEIENFHHLNPELQNDWNPLFAKMRRECPVAHSERFGGFWVFASYQDVYRAYHDTDTFSSFPNSIPAGELGQQRALIPVEIDPPEHTWYREILAPVFTAHRMRILESKIRAHAVELIDGILERGECEFISEFAKLLPSRIFLELVGWPIEDAPRFLQWADVLMRAPMEENPEESLLIQTATQIYGYFGAELAKREQAGPPVLGEEADLIDRLRGASFGGQRQLTQVEILDCILLLLLAGLDTTQGVLGRGWEFLATHEEYRRDVVEQPEVAQTAVEELLRFFAPVQPGRRVTQDVDLHGVHLSAGDRVMLLTGSACRDTAEFPDPEKVDFRRSPNRHIAFGAGAHRCLGSHLARLELQIALQEWHRRIPEYRIKPGTEVRRHLSAVSGVDELHLEFG
ncbi:MAG TPA: cytochrome P450 [Pseudonocardia sp.]|nr:cytochrome P450 [Pseudonocardia sp.]